MVFGEIIMKYSNQRQHKKQEKPRYERKGSKIIIVENGAEREERFTSIWAAKRFWRGLKL